MCLCADAAGGRCDYTSIYLPTDGCGHHGLNCHMSERTATCATTAYRSGPVLTSFGGKSAGMVPTCLVLSSAMSERGGVRALLLLRSTRLSMHPGPNLPSYRNGNAFSTPEVGCPSPEDGIFCARNNKIVSCKST